MEDYISQKQYLRSLALQVAEIAEDPIQKRKKDAWKAHNALRPVRPMFMMDQLPYCEMNVDDELSLKCTDGLLRHFEWTLKELLYRCKHMPDDRVVEAVIRSPKAVGISSIGVDPVEDVIHTDGFDQVLSHAYKNNLPDEEALNKLVPPVVTEDKNASKTIFETAGDIFDGILKVVHGGVDTNGHVWDRISTICGVEQCIIDLYDRPDFIHKVCERIFGYYNIMLDQFEALGLIDPGQPLIHCTGAYSDQLPGFNGESDSELEPFRHSAKNVWTYGAAQLFSMVSPDMHEEFEIEYQKKWYSRFGLGYYGCCEPLDRKVHVIRALPNVRKISMSPWVDISRGAEAMNGDYVFSFKPNPAFLASDTSWSEYEIRTQLETVIKENAKYGNPAELILKDVSTIGHKPSRLWDWARIAREVCGE
ncbi:MAG: hypothetical protein AB9835_03420 [Eubacteriales bacterium]